MVDPETYRTLLSSGGGAIQPNHFDFTKWLCASGKKGQSRLRLFGTYLKVASVELDMSHHEISIISQRIEPRNSWSELPSGLPLR